MIPTPFGLRPFPPDRGNRPHPPATNIYYIGRRGRWGHRPAPEPASTAACNRRVFPIQIDRSLKGEFRRPGGGFLCSRRQRNQNAVFCGPFSKKVSSGGQTLSDCPLSFRATGPWREKGRKHAPLLGSAWPVPCCSAGHGRWAAKNHSCNETPIPCVGAAFRRPPHLDQPLRLVATGALSWSSRTAFRKPPDQRQRRRTEGNPITARAGVAVQSPGKRPP